MIGRANNILDNLIAEGKAKPMVVVMPLGHAIQASGPVRPRAIRLPAARALRAALRQAALAAHRAEPCSRSAGTCWRT